MPIKRDAINLRAERELSDHYVFTIKLVYFEISLVQAYLQFVKLSRNTVWALKVVLPEIKVSHEKKRLELLLLVDVLMFLLRFLP